MMIAAVRGKEEMEIAFASGVKIIFDLSPSILTLKETVLAAHEAGKKLFIHIDLAEGIGKDKAGICFAKEAGVDGIISTRANIIKAAREAGLFTVQRFFAVDSQSVHTTIETVRNSRPDMVEIMPGIIEKVIGDLKQQIKTPMIAGGLIETKEEVSRILAAGAAAVSSGKKELWG